MAEWILIATLRDTPPRVVAVGRSPRPLKPLDQVVRGPRRGAIEAAVDAAVKTGEPVHEIHEHGRFRVAAEPFVTPLGRVNGVRACAVPLPGADGVDVPLPQRTPGGAWAWELDGGKLHFPDSLQEMDGVPEEDRRPEWTSMQGLERVLSSTPGYTDVLAKAMTGVEGTEINDVVQIQGLDGILRDVRFAARIEMLPERGRMLQGISFNITDGIAAVPAPMSFAEAVVAAGLAMRSGEHTMILDIPSLHPVRWLSSPPETLQWRITGDLERDPAFHPEDVPALRKVVEELSTIPTRFPLRMRATDGSWAALECTATVMMINHAQGVRAAMLRLRHVS